MHVTASSLWSLQTQPEPCRACRCIAGNLLPVALQGSISESLVNLTALSQL